MNYSLKIAGLIVFLAGLGLIGWTLFSSYNIFTAKSSLPEFFEMPKGEISIQKEDNQDAQAQLQKMIGEQLKGFLPVDAMTKILNLTVWSILAFILIFGGSQISNLGIKLIKKE